MKAPRIDQVELADLLRLEPHGPDTFVAIGVRYPWGPALYGGQVVAQALRAAAETVDADRRLHSLHSYFIRPGLPDEPVRLEIERLRDGRSFSTRQVVARQSTGAILNLSASFKVDEDDQADISVGSIPDHVPPPDELPSDVGGHQHFDRRLTVGPDGTLGGWIRVTAEIDNDPVEHVCALAYASDGVPSNGARSLHPDYKSREESGELFIGASLDHSMWLHRPTDPTAWHWFEINPHSLSSGRGLVTGDVFRIDGQQVATYAQEVLFRLRS